MLRPGPLSTRGRGRSISELSCPCKSYRGFPHFRQNVASSASKVPQFRHLMRTTSFVEFGGFGELATVRVEAKACCIYESIVSGDPMPVPPSIPPTDAPP